MAEARQKEMKVNITVVATKTLMAGLELPTEVAILQGMRRLIINKPLEDSIGERGWWGSDGWLAGNQGASHQRSTKSPRSTKIRG